MKALGWLLLGLVAIGGAAQADEARLTFGGDAFVAGQSATVDQSARDAFAAGYDVSLTGPVQGDAHLAGFNVRAEAPVQGDTYAAGFSVNINATTGGDLTAMGNTVNVAPAAAVTGNARLAGALVTMSAPVSGSALVSAKTLALDAPIAGDFNFFGEAINFGPNAKVTGKLTIQAPAQIAVPETVASADRVTFQQLASTDLTGQAGKTAEHVVNSFWPAVWVTALWWLLLFIVGLAFVALAPRLVERLQAVATARPVRSFGWGFLAFASVIGLVPLSALTIIGLIVTPLFLLLAFILCALAYLAGAYLFGSMLIGAITRLDTLPKRALSLAVSLIVAGLLAILPFIGWLITLLIVTFGFGAIALATTGRGGRAAPEIGPRPVQTPEPV